MKQLGVRRLQPRIELWNGHSKKTGAIYLPHQVRRKRSKSLIDVIDNALRRVRADGR